MRILFGQGAPAPLRKVLTAHSVQTAFERGRNDMRNGELLDAAEAQGFDVLVTTDQRLKHQQNLSDRNIAVLVLMTTSWPRIQRHAEAVVETLATLAAGEYRELSFPL